MNNYYANLPKKNMASGALIFDTDNKLLIVKPSYKDHWSIPGGVVEKNESPYDACKREVFEEVGLQITPTKLLAVNYMGDEKDEIDALMFIFDSGVLSCDFKEKIKLQENEIEEYKFIETHEISANLGYRMSHILNQFINDNSQSGLYLENMEKLI